jgi:signal transduction histidine kinase
VSYKIVHDHNGDITVESAAGRGTKITVQLPFS